MWTPPWLGSTKIPVVNLDRVTGWRVVFGHGVREVVSAPGAILQIKVRLLGISPMSCRRILVPESVSLRVLHGEERLAGRGRGVDGLFGGREMGALVLEGRDDEPQIRKHKIPWGQSS